VNPNKAHSRALELAALLVVCLLVIGAGAARAQSAPATKRDAVAARLQYTLSSGAERCPDARTIEQAVSTRLGYPVFEREPPTRWVRVQIGATPRGLRAKLEVLGEGDVSLGARAIESSADCGELASTLALAISIALDPTQMLAPKVAPEAVAEPCPVCPVCPPLQAIDVERAPAVAADPPAPDPPSFEGYGMAVGPTLGIGVLPKVSGAGHMELFARWTRISVHAGGVIHPGAGVDGIDAQLLMGQLALCARMVNWPGIIGSLCAAASVGSLGGYQAANDDHDTSLSAAGGAQARVAADLIGPVFGEARADLEANFIRTTLRVGDAPAWTTPPFWAQLSLSVGVRFP